jgi:hypothetical protein
MPPRRVPLPGEFFLCHTRQKHNAHGPEVIKVQYPFHPLHGQSLLVQRRAKLPNGEYIFCELPDGTIGGFPSWIADPTRTPNFTLGPPLTSAAALAQLRTLLDGLRSNSQRDIASLKGMRREDPNDTKENARDEPDEPTVL